MSTPRRHPGDSATGKPLLRFRKAAARLSAFMLLAGAAGMAGCEEPPTAGTSTMDRVIVSGVVRTSAGVPVAGATLRTEHRRRGCDSVCVERYEPYGTNERGEFNQASVFWLGQTESSVLTLLVSPPAGSRLRSASVPFDARLVHLPPYDSVHLTVVLDPE